MDFLIAAAAAWASPLALIYYGNKGFYGFIGMIVLAGVADALIWGA